MHHLAKPSYTSHDEQTVVTTGASLTIERGEKLGLRKTKERRFLDRQSKTIFLNHNCYRYGTLPNLFANILCKANKNRIDKIGQNLLF